MISLHYFSVKKAKTVQLLLFEYFFGCICFHYSKI